MSNYTLPFVLSPCTLRPYCLPPRCSYYPNYRRFIPNACAYPPTTSPDALPSTPFDPILALYLAAYSFRAYHPPPSSAYREVHATPYPPSPAPSMHTIICHLVYPTTRLIASSATGVFLLHLAPARLPDAPFITACINSAIIPNVLSRRHISILRTAYTHHSLEDRLILNLYPTARIYETGGAPSHTASLPLHSLVEAAFSDAHSVDGSPRELVFRPLQDEERQTNYFQFSLLRNDVKLPFFFGQKPGTSNDPNGAQYDGLSIIVRPTFIPFKEHDLEALRKRRLSVENFSPRDASVFEVHKHSVESAANIEMRNADVMSSKEVKLLENARTVLRSRLPRGMIPNPKDWHYLADAAHMLYVRIKDTLPAERTSTVSQNAPPALFVESRSTDTEVWLFHDEKHRDIIISFRGTEQGCWQDFFTDAQTFLQRWEPGEEIDLTICIDRTIGLSKIIPSIIPTMKSCVPSDASAVHFGFLRAYVSVRKTVWHAIELVTGGISQGYTYHFTGHSLGGALATLAAVDFQAVYGVGEERVHCMSFGAPKVGNVFFARIYNVLVPNSFRIVNGADLVSRMPYSIGKNAQINKYKHSGRTVSVDETGEYWIEGMGDGEVHDDGSSNKNIQDLFHNEKELWEEHFSGRSVKHHMVRLC